MTDALTALPALARSTLARHFGLPDMPPAVDPENLQKPGACFVTLTRNGELRGCIGSLEAYRPLLDDLRSNALAAALRDPRFRPLGADELPQIAIEVSVLSEPQPLTFTSEADALARLRPSIDGVIFSAGGRRSTFLPQVWEQLPKPVGFLARLKQKAGLPADYWGPDVQLAVYQVRAFHEADRGE